MECPKTNRLGFFYPVRISLSVKLDADEAMIAVGVKAGSISA
jgi:hypothetical protein